MAKGRISNPTKNQQQFNAKHFSLLSAGFSEALISGKFCDVKIVCQDSNLWAHRVVLSTVSPFLTNLLQDFERRGDDVITIFLPLIKGYHMKLVLDYIYSGAMYLCGAHMQFVIQVMEVLQLKCGVSVNKMVQSETSTADLKWIEVEHSTVKIKSNIPPSLPEIGGDQSSSQPTPSNARPDHQPSSSTKTRLPRQLSSVTHSPKRDQINTSLDTSDDCVVLDTEQTDTDNGSGHGREHANSDGVTDVAFNSESEGDFEKDAEEKGDEDDEVEVVEKENNGGNKVDTPSADNPGNKHSEDDSDDMVVVEIDEAFAVHSLSNSQAGLHEGRKHKCALCGRLFRFYQNLRVHLTGHLGVTVSISRCHTCKRNFKNQTELNLHMKSHSYARHLGKYRLARSAEETARKEARMILTTVGPKHKKIVRKYAKERATSGILTRKRAVSTTTTADEEDDNSSQSTAVSSPSTRSRRHQTVAAAVTPPTTGGSSGGGGRQQLTCEVCDKSFGVRSMYVRHIESKHKGLAEKAVIKSLLLDKKSFIKLKNCSAVVAKQSTAMASSKSALTAASSSPATSNKSKSFATPSRKREASPPQSKQPLSKRKKDTDKMESPARPKVSLQCPDCDRMFIAKTILERHLYTAKHGVYSMYSSDSGPGSPQPAPPSKEVHPLLDRAVDCHLCGQHFNKVKDFAKHREKACTAWNA